MEIKDLAIKGLRIITPDVYGDDRGFFVEQFNTERYVEILGPDIIFVQDNISRSDKGVLRGLHYQKDPHGQGKLVSVMSGSVFDVAVDIRENSSTFGSYVSVTLKAPYRNKDGVWIWEQFWIPEGFAHGFLALEDNTTFTYKCSKGYAPEHDAGVMWNDKDINIVWPSIEEEFIISEKDKEHPLLNEIDPYKIA